MGQVKVWAPEGDRDDRRPKMRERWKHKKSAAERCVEKRNKVFWYVTFKDLIIAAIYKIIVSYTSDGLLNFSFMLDKTLQVRNHLRL